MTRPAVAYRHRQFSAVLCAMMCLFAMVFVSLGITTSLGWIGLLAAGILVIAALVFSSLSVEISDAHLRWRFGIGLIRKQVPLAQILSAEVTRTRFWEGWGIHLTTRGWLYNVAGFDAVIVRLATGKQFMLGTDEPTRLAAALGRSIG